MAVNHLELDSPSVDEILDYLDYKVIKDYGEHKIVVKYKVGKKWTAKTTTYDKLYEDAEAQAEAERRWD